MDYAITIVGSYETPHYRHLQTGDVLILRREPDNPHDPCAVAAFWQDGTRVGYVANSEDTVLPGTMSATRLGKLLDPRRVAMTTVRLGAAAPNPSRGGSQKRFSGTCFFVPLRTPEEQEHPRRTVILTVAGSHARHGHKSQMLAALKERGEASGLPLTLRRVTLGESTRYLFFEENESSLSCGELDPGRSGEDPEPVISWFEDHPEGSLGAVTLGAPFLERTGDSPHSPRLRHVKAEITLAEEENPSLWSDAVDRCIARGCGQLREIEERIAVMTANRVRPGVISRVLAAMKPCSPEVPGKPARPYRSTSMILSDALAFSLASMPLRLMGEKGSGKNTLIETICWLLNQPMVRIQGSVELDRMDLMGSPQLTGGSTTFRLSQAMEALRDGKTLVIDEANLVRPDILALLHSATDDARSVLVPGYGPVPLHPTSQVVYTVNEGYIGTGDMNEATVDRTVTFELPQESSLKHILSGFPPDRVEICQKVSDAIRKGVKEGTLPAQAVTVRGFLDALRVEDVDLGRALQVCVANKVPDSAVREALISIISLYCG